MSKRSESRRTESRRMNSLNKKKPKRKSKKFIALLVVFGVVFFAFGIVLGSLYYMASGLTTTDLPTDNVSLGISDTAENDNNVINIALFGVDARDDSDSGRSDAIIILSVDNEHGAIKMTSILRDSKVTIEGHGETKLNHAYAYGGPTLAIKTLNQTYDLDIKEYVTVNFNQLAQIVDSVGGITLSLTEAEVASANGNLASDAPDAEAISGSGKMVLDGDQAVAFSRIRDIDSDNARTDRQQQVLSQILSKVKSMPKTDYPKFIREFLSIVETSLDYADLIGISPIMLKSDLQFVQNTIPDEAYEGLNGGIASDGVWYWNYDLDEAADRLHSIIYESE